MHDLAIALSCTVAELKARMTPQELDSWIEYARLKGGVSPLSRIESAVWQTGSMNVAATINASGTKTPVKAKDYMPEVEFNPMTSVSGEEDIDKVVAVLSGSRSSATSDAVHVSESGLKIRSGRSK